MKRKPFFVSLVIFLAVVAAAVTLLILRGGSASAQETTLLFRTTPIREETVQEYLMSDDATFMLTGLYSAMEKKGLSPPELYTLPVLLPIVSEDFSSVTYSHIWYCPIFHTNGRIVAMMSLACINDRISCTVSGEFVGSLNAFLEDYGPRPICMFTYQKVCYALDMDGRHICLNPDRWGQLGGDPTYDLTLSDEQVARLLKIASDVPVSILRFDSRQRVEIPPPEPADTHAVSSARAS